MANMSGGEAVVASLVRQGVEVVFGIPGIHMSGIIAAMRDEPSIRLITTRHEQGAAHMADGYARVSGKPGVVLLVPGADPTTPLLRWQRRTPGPPRSWRLSARFRARRSAKAPETSTRFWINLRSFVLSPSGADRSCARGTFRTQ